jgi:hypothetical protein
MAPLSVRLPRDLPPGVAAILASTLKQDPASLNTDWFGTLLVKGLLEWAPRGVPEARDFAKAWLEFHLNSQRLAPYSGNRSRTVRAGGVVITTYCGHYGLSFPCFEIFQQLRDPRARRVCLDIADIILHQSARNRYGMVAHDDTAEFAIPDTCYFVVTPLMIAARLDSQHSAVYRAQAIYQLRTNLDVFLIKETGLAKTILLASGLGRTYWTRATGWLLWSITGVLRHLSPQDPHFDGFVRDLAALARGIARVQDPAGGLHLFLDDPKSPLETTGAALCAMGLHEAIRKRWLPDSFTPTVDRAWDFVKRNITPDGGIRQAYTGWAVPAEQDIVEMDRRSMGWIPGFILSAAHELTTS